MLQIPGERNVFTKEADKILKYKDFITEIERMWNVKARARPVRIGATEAISKSLRQYLSNLPGKRKINELQQKTAILGTAYTYYRKC